MPHDSEMGAGSDSARETMRVSNLIKTSKFLSRRIRQPPVLYLDSESNIKSNKSRELTKRSKLKRFWGSIFAISEKITKFSNFATRRGGEIKSPTGKTAKRTQAQNKNTRKKAGNQNSQKAANNLMVAAPPSDHKVAGVRGSLIARRTLKKPHEIRRAADPRLLTFPEGAKD